MVSNEQLDKWLRELEGREDKRVVVRTPRRASVTAFVDGCSVGNTGGRKSFRINKSVSTFLPFDTIC